jgi:acetyltransferase
MDLFFTPRSIAVVGVSERPENLGRRIAQNLQEFDFNGIVYLVGPRGGTAFGRRIYRSVSDIPDQVDLAVILVPARFVPGVVEECGHKGIRRAVIETAGFSELGDEGKAIEAELVEMARRHKIRFVGPNCIGVMNMANGLEVSFPSMKNVFQRGSISIISQSGGVGIQYLNVMASENLGLAKFASIGNKLDVDENDLLEYLIDDEQTQIIVMYLEGITDGRRLMEIARRTSKPILLHKSNIGALAQKIAASHTASLSGDDAVVSAALEQVGIARFSDADTLVNYLKVLPLPRIKGNRLAVLSRSGGHAVIAADACEEVGFELTNFPDEFLRQIEGNFRAKVIKLTNPLDLGDLFDFDAYTRIVKQTLELAEVDGLVFMHLYVSAVERELSRAFLGKLEEFSFAQGKPVAACVSTDEEELSALRRALPQPIFTAPQDAVSALALLRDFDHQARPELEVPAGTLDRSAIEAILARCNAEERDPMLDEALEIMGAAGLPIAPFTVVESPWEAAAAAESFDQPIVLKLISRQFSHKTDIGGVKLGLEDPAGARRGYETLVAAARAAGAEGSIRALAQPMIENGMEMILGANLDHTFGPTVLVGAGGIFVEVFGDVAMRVVPFGEAEAAAMLRQLRVWPLLTGARGRRERDVKALEQGVLAIARLVQAFPQIRELDVNPLMVLHEGALAVDARLVLG